MEQVYYLCPKEYNPIGVQKPETCGGSLSYEEGKYIIDLQKRSWFNYYVKLGKGYYESDGITYRPSLSSYYIVPEDALFYKYFLAHTNDDTIMCHCLQPEDALSGNADDINNYMLQKTNEIRKKYTNGVAPPVQLHEDLIHVAQWSAYDYATHSGLPPHMDSLGRYPQKRYNKMVGGNLLISENVSGGGDMQHSMDYYYDILDSMFQGWILSPNHFENMINPNHMYAGFGFAKVIHGDTYTVAGVMLFGQPRKDGWAFSDIDKKLHNARVFIEYGELDNYVNSYNHNCIYDLKWHQILVDNVFYCKASNDFEFFVKGIEDCHVVGADLMRYRPNNLKQLAVTNLTPKRKAPSGNGVEFVYDLKYFRFILLNIFDYDLIPGDILLGHVYYRDGDDIKSILTSSGCFETAYFTSAIFDRYCQVAKEEDWEKVLNAENDDEAMSYIVESDTVLNDRMLNFLTRAKVKANNGKFYYVQLSDFYEYQPGERVLIFKNGVNYMHNTEKLVTVLGDKLTFKEKDFNEECDITVLSSSNVRYGIDEVNDIVVPFDWWGKEL